MKRAKVLFGLFMILGVGIAQDSPATAPNTKGSDASGEASAEHIYGRKDGVKPPKVLSYPVPDYPEKARIKQGTVVLRLVVGSNGLPREIEVVRSVDTDPDKAAVEAVKKWKFAPATKDGKPVASKTDVEVSFRRY